MVKQLNKLPGKHNKNLKIKSLAKDEKASVSVTCDNTDYSFYCSQFQIGQKGHGIDCFGRDLNNKKPKKKTEKNDSKKDALCDLATTLNSLDSKRRASTIRFSAPDPAGSLVKQLNKLKANPQKDLQISSTKKAKDHSVMQKALVHVTCGHHKYQFHCYQFSLGKKNENNAISCDSSIRPQRLNYAKSLQDRIKK